MSKNLGKKWEEKFKEGWNNTFPHTPLIRLVDQQSRYQGTSSNVSDFIAFNNHFLYLLECKETMDGTFGLFSINKKTGEKYYTFRQYEKLLEYKDYKDTLAGVILWFSKYDEVVWVSIQEIEKMVNNGVKSIKYTYIKTKEYELVQIPHTTPRKYPICDFSIMPTLYKGE